MNKEWKKYPPTEVTNIGCDCFYQKLIKKVKGEEIYANIIQWTLGVNLSYELEIQIPYEVSPTGKTINIQNFNYSKLDFKLIEKHAKQLIKLLEP